MARRKSMGGHSARTLRKSPFLLATVKHGDEHVRGYAIQCGKCPHQGRMPIVTSMAIDGELRKVQRKFEEIGWFIAGTMNKHRCPKCVEEERRERQRAKDRDVRLSSRVVVATPTPAPVLKLVPAIPKPEPVPVVIVASPTPEPIPMSQPTKTPNVPPPPEMGTDDRRVIFAKLNEVYVDPKEGYGEEWTDERVSVDLGVPRDWVKKTREAFFGPAGGNSKLTAQLAEARKVYAQCKEMMEASSTLHAQAQAMMDRANALLRETAPLQVQMSKVLGMVIEIERAVKP